LGRFDEASVEIFDDELDDAEYRRFLEVTDLMLLPYLTDAYYQQTSGVFAEAVGMGIPTIVSRGTWMARQLSTFGGGLTALPGDGQSLLDTTLHALTHISDLKNQATHAANEWRKFHNAKTLIDLIEREIGSRS
jgi:hypothetical protein